MVLALGMSLSCSLVHADSDELDDLIVGAANLQQSVESVLYGQRVRAVPVPGVRGRCQRVGIIYLDSRGRGGPRINNYDVCGREVIEVDDVSPALPDDNAMRQVTQSAMRAAATYGHRTMRWQGYLIRSNRLTPPDTYGCAQTETTVASEGLLVAHSMGRICP